MADECVLEEKDLIAYFANFKPNGKDDHDPRDSVGSSQPKNNLRALLDGRSIPRGRFAAMLERQGGKPYERDAVDTWLSGKRYMPNSCVVQAAGLLGVSIPYILDLTDNPSIDARPAQGYAKRRQLLVGYAKALAMSAKMVQNEPVDWNHTDGTIYRYPDEDSQGIECRLLRFVRCDGPIQRSRKVGHPIDMPTERVGHDDALAWRTYVDYGSRDPMEPDYRGYLLMAIDEFLKMPGDYRDLSTVAASAFENAMDCPESKASDDPLFAVTPLLLKRYHVA